MRPGVVRGFYLLAGMLALLLGALGVVLPLLPTTPFVILAAFCFSRSSERLHQWLLNQRLFGPLIRDWEAHGVIPLRIKWLSTSMMLLLVSYPMLFRDFDWRLKALAGASILCALLYIWTRPSVPAQVPSRQNA
ncbi:YbaN family protein [Marinobacterium rhizophilum]|uniref:Inner membrane protein n=1 Tax=Marinobacterium rhizophilum TaxID=420402 RepID=A0ABY5HKJ7_9GAMM|nr:YbaN family protein [Marinobacterium rhizophilum]UTW12479.1 YbaN family protein [Marinobacterium rhizophilum]